MLRKLSLDTLHTAEGGRVALLFKRHLERAVQDCEDRPGDKNKRKVTVNLLLSPVIGQDGATCDTNVEIELTSSIPKHITRPINCRMKHGGQLVFNDMSEDNVDQLTLDEA